MTHHTRTFVASLTLSLQIVATSLYSGLTLTKERMKVQFKQTAKQ